MVNVVLGTKVADFSFHISDIELETLKQKDLDYTITKNGDIMISESKNDYMVLSGSFDWSKLMKGDYDAGIRSLTGISVVENGKVTYTATGLGMTGDEVGSGTEFKAYLAEKGYAIKGNTFGNEIEAADQNDLIRGMNGDDTIDGRAGNDKLYGDVGADRLIGGEGTDFLSGGAGADIFVFEAGDGNDTILDFRARGKGQDQIDVSNHAGVASFEDLEIRDAGRNVIIIAGDDMITLKNVSEHAVDASDFIF